MPLSLYVELSQQEAEYDTVYCHQYVFAKEVGDERDEQYGQYARQAEACADVALHPFGQVVSTGVVSQREIEQVVHHASYIE